jgi:hypothetical protein
MVDLCELFEVTNIAQRLDKTRIIEACLDSDYRQCKRRLDPSVIVNFRSTKNRKLKDLTSLFLSFLRGFYDKRHYEYTQLSQNCRFSYNISTG